MFYRRYPEAEDGAELTSLNGAKRHNRELTLQQEN